MATKEAQVQALFEKLDGFIASDQHAKAAKVASDILALLPGDEDALRCKVVALMNQSEFAEALSSIPAGSDAFAFEKAYCLYRCGRLAEALQAAAAIPAADAPARLQLEAQLHYRLGNNKECIQLYDRLFQQHRGEESLELKTNVLAAYVAAQLAPEIPDLMAAMKINPKQGFEVGYNKACGLVDVGDWAAAEAELRAALKLGRETLLLEDCPEEEVEEELSTLTLQLAYVMSRSGRQAEAQQTYGELARNEALDDVTRAVALCNQIAGSNRLDGAAANRKFVSSSIKKLEALMEPDARPGAARLNADLESRMSPQQKLGLFLNYSLLCLAADRAEVAREVAAALAARHPRSGPVALLQAAVKVREGQAAEADKALAAYAAAAAAPSDALPATLMRVQVALDGKDISGAQALLQAIPDPAVRYSGGVVATCFALYDAVGDLAAAEALTSAALAYWQQQAQQPAGGKGGKGGGAPPDGRSAAAVTWCLQSLVSLKLRLGKVTDAAACFQKLQASGSSSAAGVEVLARLVRATAATDTSAALSLASALPRLPDTSHLDLDRLEESASRSAAATAAAATNIPVPASQKAAAADAASRKRGSDAMEVEGGAAASAAAGGSSKPKKSSRRKRRRLPKGYDATKPDGGLPAPDPERWLPKWQRSEYKKRRRGRGKDQVKGSQGAGKVDENLDRTKASAADAAGGKGSRPSSAMPSLPAKKGKGKR